MKKLISLLLFLLFTSTNTYALDWKGFTGAQCRPIYEGGPSYYISTYSSILYNSSNTSLYIVCPIVREEPVGDVGQVSNVSINVWGNSTSNSYCTFQSIRKDGTIYSSEQQYFGPGSSTLSFDNIDSVDFGRFSIVCRLTPAAAGFLQWNRIINYSITEVD